MFFFPGRKKLSVKSKAAHVMALRKYLSVIMEHGISHCSQDSDYSELIIYPSLFIQSLLKICHLQRGNALAARVSHVAKENQNATGNSLHV